jgi:hypothetical protein
MLALIRALQLMALSAFGGCVAYETERLEQHPSGVIFVNDPYCDDSGVRGYWCDHDEQGNKL